MDGCLGISFVGSIVPERCYCSASELASIDSNRSLIED